MTDHIEVPYQITESSLGQAIMQVDIPIEDIPEKSALIVPAHIEKPAPRALRFTINKGTAEDPQPMLCVRFSDNPKAVLVGLQDFMQTSAKLLEDPVG